MEFARTHTIHTRLFEHTRGDLNIATCKIKKKKKERKGNLSIVSTDIDGRGRGGEGRGEIDSLIFRVFRFVARIYSFIGIDRSILMGINRFEN